MDRHYHPVVFARLKVLLAGRDWNALQEYLESLSNAHFRIAGYILGERLMPTLEAQDFWDLSSHLILWYAKAFTVTVAKAAALRFKAGSLQLTDEGFKRLADSLQGEGHVIDRQKLLMQWLPCMPDFEAVESLFDTMGIVDARRRVDYLLRIGNLNASFVLLRTLRYEEHDKKYLTSVCKELVRRAANKAGANEHEDSLSYNMASLLRSYFDLPDVRGTFSLAIEAYELANIDTDFEVFERVVTKV